MMILGSHTLPFSYTEDNKIKQNWEPFIGSQRIHPEKNTTDKNHKVMAVHLLVVFLNQNSRPLKHRAYMG